MKLRTVLLAIALWCGQAFANPPTVPAGQLLIETPTAYNIVKILDDEVNDENGLIRGAEITQYNKDGVPKAIVNGQEVGSYVRIMLYNCTNKIYFWVSLEVRNTKNEMIEETLIIRQVTPILPQAEKEISFTCEKPPKVPFKREAPKELPQRKSGQLDA